MAVDDIRIKFSFFDHLKTKRLIRQCGIEGAWCLLMLWRYAGMNCTKGLLKGFSPSDIEDAAGWTGLPNQLYDALNGSFIDLCSDGYYLHDWEEHQGYLFYSQERSEQAREAGRASAIARKKGKKTKKLTGSQPPVELPVEPTVELNGNEQSTPYPYPYPSPIPSPIPNPLPKEKHIPEKTKYLDTVFLTDNEYQKLKTRYNSNLDRVLEIYDAWKTNTSEKKRNDIKSDYKSMLATWVKEKLDQEIKMKPKQPIIDSNPDKFKKEHGGW